MALKFLLLQLSHISKFCVVFQNFPTVKNPGTRRHQHHLIFCKKSIKLRKTKGGRIRENQNTRNKQTHNKYEMIKINIFCFTIIFLVLRNVRNLDFAEIGPGNKNKKNCEQEDQRKSVLSSRSDMSALAEMRFGCKNAPGQLDASHLRNQ